MGVLIDASILIDHERGRLDLGSNIRGREDEGVFLSAITVSELLHGVHRATGAGVRARRSAFVEAVIEAFPVLDIDLATARAHARLWADLARRGRLIGSHDLWIAATCLAHGLSIATGDRRDFERVPGLVLEDWSGE